MVRESTITLAEDYAKAQLSEKLHRLECNLYSMFTSLGLAVPDKGEYRHASDGGFIVFLNEAGCVVRLHPKNKPTITTYDHPHIIKPLGSRSFRGVRVDIFPAVETQGELERNGTLCKALQKDGFLFWDPQPLNSGYLPQMKPGTGALPLPDLSLPKHPIVIDPGAVGRDLFITQWIGHLLRAAGIKKYEAKENPQDALYAPLRAAFDKGWPKGLKDDDYPKLGEFWSLCREYRKHGALTPSWLNDKDDSYNQIKEKSKKYEARLNEHYAWKREEKTKATLQ